MAVCTDHPAEPALYACPACLRLLCPACFTADPRGEKRCGTCGGEVQRIAPRTGSPTTPPLAPPPTAPDLDDPLPLADLPRRGRPTAPPSTLAAPYKPPAGAVSLPRAHAIATPPPPITSRLGPVFAFGVRKELLVTLAGLAAITTLLRWIGVRAALGAGALVLLIPLLISAGLEAAFYFHVVEQRAAGDDRFQMPELSAMSEILTAFLRYVATLLPMLFALFWYGDRVAGHWWLGMFLFAIDPTAIFHTTGPAMLLVAGIALWPLMTIIAAIWRSAEMAYHPGIWIKALKLLGTDYAVGVLVFYGILLVEALVLPALARALPHVELVTLFVVTLVGYIPMAIRARLLGEICEPYFRL